MEEEAKTMPEPEGGKGEFFSQNDLKSLAKERGLTSQAGALAFVGIRAKKRGADAITFACNGAACWTYSPDAHTATPAVQNTNGATVWRHDYDGLYSIVVLTDGPATVELRGQNHPDNIDVPIMSALAIGPGTHVFPEITRDKPLRFTTEKWWACHITSTCPILKVAAVGLCYCH